MRRVLHLSDLHFGRLHPPALESLRQFLAVQEENLDLIVVTGDWTQRARRNQFASAADFLSELRTTVVTIPGNHDIPLYNLWARLLHPYRNYKRYIGARTTDVYVDECIAVAGISTVNRFTPVAGKAHRRELQRAHDLFCRQPRDVVRILAGHHPLETQELSWIDADLVLSGHCHASQIEWLERPGGAPILHVSAGTSVSSRLREEVNSFHILQFANRTLQIETMELRPEGFVSREAEKKIFHLSPPRLRQDLCKNNSEGRGWI